MRIIVLLLLLAITCTGRTQTVVYTSDSLCRLIVPAAIVHNCETKNCDFLVAITCRSTNSNLLPGASISVFNRWGQEVYSTELKEQKGWNGGEEKEGVYFWVLTYYEDQQGAKIKKSATGAITLIR